MLSFPIKKHALLLGFGGQAHFESTSSDELEDMLFWNTQYSKGWDFILVWQSARLGMTSLSNFSSFKTVWKWKHFNPFQNPSIATSCPTVPPISALFLAWNHWLLMLVLRNWLIQNLYPWPGHHLHHRESLWELALVKDNLHWILFQDLLLCAKLILTDLEPCLQKIDDLLKSC